MKEDEIVKALPKSFRIFLALEEEARGEKTNNPRPLSSNIKATGGEPPP